jgi:hypothetical protein
VLVAFVLLAAVPFVAAATHASFWQKGSPPVTTAAVAALLVALVTGRRWAWLVLVLFYSFVVVSFAWEWGSTPLFVVDLAALGLLASSPMRRHVGWRLARDARPSGRAGLS